jgi:hypothetical protein
METQHHVQGVHPNLYRLTMVHSRGSLLPVRLPRISFWSSGVADSIVCGVRVLIDAGGEGKWEYLDNGGQLLAVWRIRRLGEKIRTKQSYI